MMRAKVTPEIVNAWMIDVSRYYVLSRNERAFIKQFNTTDKTYTLFPFKRLGKSSAIAKYAWAAALENFGVKVLVLAPGGHNSSCWNFIKNFATIERSKSKVIDAQSMKYAEIHYPQDRSVYFNNKSSIKIHDIKSSFDPMRGTRFDVVLIDDAEARPVEYINEFIYPILNPYGEVHCINGPTSFMEDFDIPNSNFEMPR